MTPDNACSGNLPEGIRIVGEQEAADDITKTEWRKHDQTKNKRRKVSQQVYISSSGLLSDGSRDASSIFAVIAFWPTGVPVLYDNLRGKEDGLTSPDWAGELGIGMEDVVDGCVSKLPTAIGWEDILRGGVADRVTCSCTEVDRRLRSSDNSRERLRCLCLAGECTM